MDYKEPKKRVTKNDKKHKKQTLSQKHIRAKLNRTPKTQTGDRSSGTRFLFSINIFGLHHIHSQSTL